MVAVFGPYPAIVTNVHDGDTVTMSIDLGFNIKYTINCRLYGINAPELNTDAGKASRDHLREILAALPEVQVTSYGWDKYGGRFDGVIRVPSSASKSVNDRMVDDGFAVPYPPRT